MKLRRFRQHRNAAQHAQRSARAATMVPGVAPRATAQEASPQQWVEPPRPPRTLREARDLWVEGDWPALLSTSASETWRSDDPQRMALMVATAQLQAGSVSQARAMLRDARATGAGRHAVAQVLLASVHNTLGRVSALLDDPGRSLAHFAASVSLASPASASARAIQARARAQIAQLGLNVNVPDGAQAVNATEAAPGTLAVRPQPWFRTGSGSRAWCAAGSDGAQLAAVLAGAGRSWLATAARAGGELDAVAEGPADLAAWTAPLRVLRQNGAWLLVGNDPAGRAAGLAVPPSGATGSEPVQMAGGARLVAVAAWREGLVALCSAESGAVFGPLTAARPTGVWPVWAGAPLGLVATDDALLGIGLAGSGAVGSMVVAVMLEGSRVGQLADLCRLPTAAAGDATWQPWAASGEGWVGLQGPGSPLLVWWQHGRLRCAVVPAGSELRAAARSGSSPPVALLSREGRPWLWVAGTPPAAAQQITGLDAAADICALLDGGAPGQFWITALQLDTLAGTAGPTAHLARVDATALLNAAQSADAD